MSLRSFRIVEEMPESYSVRWEELSARARRRGASAAAHAAFSRHEMLSRAEWLAEWAEELRRPGGRFRFLVVADRPRTAETLFLCRSAVHGTRMVPAAHSMAHRFHNRTEAEAERRELMTRFLGIVNWRLEKEKVA